MPLPFLGAAWFVAKWGSIAYAADKLTDGRLAGFFKRAVDNPAGAIEEIKGAGQSIDTQIDKVGNVVDTLADPASAVKKAFTGEADGNSPTNTGSTDSGSQGFEWDIEGIAKKAGIPAAILGIGLTVYKSLGWQTATAISLALVGAWAMDLHKMIPGLGPDKPSPEIA